MRWTKHLTLAHMDAALGLILEEFGAEGYGVYWLMVEDIAAPMERQKNIPDAIHSEVKWAQICHCSVRVWRSIAYRMKEKGLIEIESFANRRQITIRNILKYKDEYLKKSEGRVEKRVERESRERAEQQTDTTVSGVAETSPAKPNHKTETGDRRFSAVFNGNNFSSAGLVEKFDIAWARHMKNRYPESKQGVFQKLLELNIDWDALDQTHIPFCAYWADHGWNYCAQTFQEWVLNGMQGPPPEAKGKNGGGPMTDQKSTYKPLPVYLPAED